MDYGVLLSLVARHVLSGVGAALIAKGYVDTDMVNAGIGAITTLAGIGWSVWQKHESGALSKPQ